MQGLKRVLVVGCGYLGLRVARLLLEAGHSVMATTRKPSRAEEFRALGIAPVVGDVTRALQLPEVDAVIHAVGFDRAAGSPMRAVYVEGLANVLRSLPGSPRFVHVSSTGVYGQAEGIVDDEGDTVPVEESGKVVLEAERVLRETRPDATVLRFAGIYGPGRLLREAALRKGEPLAADADGWLNLIHVEDGARAVVAALDHPSMTCNVCDGHPTTRRAFYSRLAELLGAPPPVFIEKREAANRRIAGTRMRTVLGVEPRYRSFEEGLPASLG
ncbi:MAG: SDR family oxidoreductase [Gemmataceae bacterium]|nr:SDR family oxidoreductase [Gemmataceae bacterium]